MDPDIKKLLVDITQMLINIDKRLQKLEQPTPQIHTPAPTPAPAQSTPTPAHSQVLNINAQSRASSPLDMSNFNHFNINLNETHSSICTDTASSEQLDKSIELTKKHIYLGVLKSYIGGGDVL